MLLLLHEFSWYINQKFGQQHGSHMLVMVCRGGTGFCSPSTQHECTLCGHDDVRGAPDPHREQRRDICRLG